MEFKCLFETRGESVCSESVAKLIELSECRDNVDDQLQTWHLSQLKGTVQEYELIVNRSGLPHDLSSDQFERLWICKKHRDDMGRNWRPLRPCQYPLHSGRKKQLKTRNAVNPGTSKEIYTIYGKHVPIGSRKFDLSSILHASKFPVNVCFDWAWSSTQDPQDLCALPVLIFVCFSVAEFQIAFISECFIAYLLCFSVICVSCFNLHKIKLGENLAWMQGL